jgi:hypothetical protein
MSSFESFHYYVYRPIHFILTVPSKTLDDRDQDILLERKRQQKTPVAQKALAMLAAYAADFRNSLAPGGGVTASDAKTKLVHRCPLLESAGLVPPTYAEERTKDALLERLDDGDLSAAAPAFMMPGITFDEISSRMNSGVYSEEARKGTAAFVKEILMLRQLLENGDRDDNQMKNVQKQVQDRNQWIIPWPATRIGMREKGQELIESARKGDYVAVMEAYVSRWVTGTDLSTAVYSLRGGIPLKIR